MIRATVGAPRRGKHRGFAAAGRPAASQAARSTHCRRGRHRRKRAAIAAAAAAVPGACCPAPSRADNDGMTLFLIGYRGCGKSTVGRRLANELWCKFHDTDAEIVARAGKSITDIFKQDGEAAFRKLEEAVVADACKLADHVIALGGGAVLSDANRAAIAASGARVIYLKCDPAVMRQRISDDRGSAENRPPLTEFGGSLQEVQKLSAEREPLYRQIATKEVDVTNLSAEEATRYVVRLL
jgi:shikimate kinase